ncbi:hypothetical protein THUN1379_33120 [Paludibacterium sp. THUN1379]|nr:hypothetical protein THUN1379_33120 [Paludibacterium sp. THUN1379]
MVKLVFTRFWFKMFGTMGFTLIFFVGYIYLLKNPSGPVHIIPLTWFDSLVDFSPAALPVYLSLWFYVSLPPVLMLSRREIARYGAKVALPCLAGLAVFYVWPNAIAPASIDWALHPGVSFLKQVDTAGNACPSLHVATAVFSAVWLFWRFRFWHFPGWLQGLNILWCLAIAWSTMAIKQHVALDVLAGTVLGLFTAWCSGLKRHACRPGG